MFILLTLVVAIIVGVIIFRTASNWTVEATGQVIFSIAGLCLFMVLVAIPINHADVNGSIAMYQETIVGVEVARADGVDMQDASLTEEIISCNQWRARIQYHKKGVWSLWIPDAVNDLEPIK